MPCLFCEYTRVSAISHFRGYRILQWASFCISIAPGFSIVHLLFSVSDSTEIVWQALQTQTTRNLGPPLLAVCWTLAAIGSVFVILRLLTRSILNHALRIDDYFMVLSLVSKGQVHFKRGIMLTV